MQLNIKDDETVELAERLAKRTGKTKTEVVKLALREQVLRDEAEIEARVASIMALAKEIRDHLSGPLPDHGELLYDPVTGLPRSD